MFLHQHTSFISCSLSGLMEFALNGISNNVFASTYTYYIPDKEQLINEVEKVLNEENK